jgi:hypothetical protein
VDQEDNVPKLPAHLSPRAPRRAAGYLAGLILATVTVPVVAALGYAGPFITQAAAAGIVAL